MELEGRVGSGVASTTRNAWTIGCVHAVMGIRGSGREKGGRILDRSGLGVRYVGSGIRCGVRGGTLRGRV